MNKLKIFVLAVICIGLFTKCNDFDELAKNPNKTEEVKPSLLLTNLLLSFRYGGGKPHSQLLTRQMVWQEIIEDYQYYKFGRASFGAYGTLRDVQKMIEEAERTAEDAYIGLAHFVRAYKFYELTITFGDVPYSEAVLGEKEGIYKPVYDDQEDVFVGILRELEEANEILANTDTYIQGDIIFNNNILKWRKVINTFSLKVLMTLSSKEGNSKISVAEQFKSIVENPEKYPLIESISENFMYIYSDKEGERYPYYNSRYIANFHLDKFFTDMLKSKEDRRLFYYAQPTGAALAEGLSYNDFDAYAGVDGTQPIDMIRGEIRAKQVSQFHERYHTNPVNEPINVIGLADKEFLLAEAAQRGWISNDAKTHYNNGIKASMQFYQKYAVSYSNCEIDADYINTYLNHPDVVYNSEKGIQQIIEQKYLNSYFQNDYQAYYDYRRTGFPEFPINPETSLNDGNENRIPVRWMYPESEVLKNKENVEAAIKKQYGEDDVNAKMWLLK